MADTIDARRAVAFLRRILAAEGGEIAQYATYTSDGVYTGTTLDVEVSLVLSADDRDLLASVLAETETLPPADRYEQVGWITVGGFAGGAVVHSQLWHTGCSDGECKPVFRRVEGDR